MPYVKKSCYIIGLKDSDTSVLTESMNALCGDFIEILGIAQNTAEVKFAFSSFIPQILMIQMPFFDPELTKIIKPIASHSKIVFYSRSAQSAIRAIKFQPVDYLLTPVNRDELAIALIKALAAIDKELGITEKPLNHSLFDVHMDEWMGLPSRAPSEIKNISHIHAEGAYSTIFLEKRELLLTKSIGKIEFHLPPDLFKRCHHSYIVNRRHISHLHKGRTPKIIMHNGTVIPVSGRRKHDFEAWLFSSQSILR